jgi:hypothetical protein
MLTPNRIAFLAALLLLCRCSETPERGFQRAQKEQSATEWRSFLSRHAALASPAMKSQAEEGLAAALLGVCERRGAASDAATCLGDLMFEVPKTKSAQIAAERLVAIAGPACSGADDDEACLLGIAERVRGQATPGALTEAAAEAAFRKCVPTGDAPCVKNVASKYENTAAGKTAARLAVDLERTPGERRALLHEHVEAPESPRSRLLRRSLCLGLRSVMLSGPSEERVTDHASLDALLEEARKMAAPDAVMLADDIGGAIKYSGCEVALLHEPTMLIDPATGAREMRVNGALRPYAQDNELSPDLLEKSQVVAVARRLVVQEPKAEADGPAVYKITYEGEVRLVGAWATRQIDYPGATKQSAPRAPKSKVSVRETLTCTVPTSAADATREQLRAAGAQLFAAQLRFRAKVLDAVDDALDNGR